VGNDARKIVLFRFRLEHSLHIDATHIFYSRMQTNQLIIWVVLINITSFGKDVFYVSSFN